MEKFIMAAGTAIRVRSIGKGEKTLVLLHGFLESLEIWDGFAEELAEKYKVLIPDLPGHGISEVKGDCHSMEFLADTVIGILDKFEIPRAVLVGHSMGGYAALAFAEKYPDRLSGLVLFHSTPNPDTEHKRTVREEDIKMIQSGKKESIALNAPAKAFAADNRRRFEDFIDELYEMVMITEDEGIIALLRGMSSRKDQNEMLRNLKVPQMFIFGRKDEHINVEVAEAIIEKQPQAKVAWLENSGHMGFVEQPNESLEAISEFVDSIG